MKKIVILTDSSGNNDKLIHRLHALFPECDIQIHLKQPENSGSTSQIQEVAAVHKAGEKYAEHAHGLSRKRG